MNKKSKEYIQKAVVLLKKLDKEYKNLKNFVLLYSINYCSNYINLDSWNNKEYKSVNLEDLKKECINKLNEGIFEELDIEDQEIYKIIKWLKYNDAPENQDDILGSIYLLSSEKNKRKKMGEHYTRIDLIEKILDELDIDDYLLKRIIDPACGSGNFLIQILRRTLNENNSNTSIVLEKLFTDSFLTGIDVQEIPCLISKLRIMMEIVTFTKEIDTSYIFPIYTLDSLLENQNVLSDESYDLVITNPPYLRYQLIEQEVRRELKSKYLSATGRFDLYTIFIEKCIRLTKVEGTSVILCSDKFMFSGYGKGIRDYVREKAYLESVHDLSEIFPFQASVLSAIYIFKKKNVKNDYDTVWKKILVDDRENKLVSKELGKVCVKDNWCYIDQSTDSVFSSIIENSEAIPLAEMVDRISIGIQTTADKVFCNKLTNNFVEENGLEKELIFPLLRGRNLSKWFFDWTGEVEGKDTNILYPYTQIDNQISPIELDEFPRVKEHLLANMSVLRDRKYFTDKKKWFELWTPHSHSMFRRTKILTPELASKCSFLLDTKGFFYNGTIYGIFLKENYDISYYKYILALLNSSVMNFIHQKLNPVHLQSKRYRFTKPILEKYPIIIIERTDSRFNKIIEVIDIIFEEPRNCLFKEEQVLNELVYSIYGLEQSEIKIIESFVELSGSETKIV